MEFKYLFTARYWDGTFTKQRTDDTSVTRPGNGSSYTDVDHPNLVSFEISNEEFVGSVDLKTGRFYVNGNEVKDETDTVGMPIEFVSHGDGNGIGPYRLQYFRRNYVHFNVDRKKVGHDVTYVIGWERDDGFGGTVSRQMHVR